MRTAKLATVLVAGVAASALLVELAAQQAKSPTRAEFTDLIGQSVEQVTTILGKPERVKANRKKDKHSADQANATWFYTLSDEKMLTLKIASGTVQSFKVTKVKAPSGVGQGSAPLGNMTNSLANTYLASACPQVRMKPTNMLTANESELLSACVAAGF